MRLRNLAALLLPCLLGCAAEVPSREPATAAASLALLEDGEMIVYRAGQAAPESELVDLGPPEGLGGTVLEGDPKISARIDYAEGGFLAGVFQATRGTVLIDFPFTEHATILKGEVILTDEAGNRARLRAGDSYLVQQGSIIRWEVKGPRVQKSFYNFTGPTDARTPMIIYKSGRRVNDCELVDLGPPEDLGGTVLEGDVEISARVDHAEGPRLGGVFQATRGLVLIDFPFTEHAAVTHGSVRLTDEVGQTHEFEEGDAYLIKRGTGILWDVDGRRVQKSFFNSTAP